LKQRLKNNWLLKLASVIIAFGIWLTISNINDPVIKKVYTSVPVTITNGSYIESRGMTYRLDSSYQTVSVTLTGSTSRVTRRSDDIVVEADLTQIVDMDSTPVMVPVTVKCSDISAENISVSPITIPIEIEERETKDFMIAVSYGDTMPGAGYEIGNIFANPEKVTVSGPESIIEKIDRVVANVSVEGMTVDCSKKADLVIYDKNQEIMSDTDVQYLTFDIGDPEVDVYVELWNTLSDINLTCTPSGEPASGYTIASVTTTPSEISLAGTEDALETLKNNGCEVEIPSDLVNISGAKTSVEQRIDLADILPEGTKSVSNQVESIIVDVEILPLGSKQISYPTQNIKITNLRQGLQVVYADSALTVTLRGKSQDLERLTKNDISATINLSGLQEGTYEVPVTITLPDNTTLLSDIKTSVQLVSLQESISSSE
jgi:YbbR domain-containing protein